MVLLNLLVLIALGIPAWVGWTWLQPLRPCSNCRGRSRRRWLRGHNLCPACGGNGQEPKPMHTFLYERVGLFRHPADETGPGWRRKRARMARQQAAGRKVIR